MPNEIVEETWEECRVRERKEKRAVDAVAYNRMLQIVEELGNKWEVVSMSEEGSLYPALTISDQNLNLQLQVGGWKKPGRLTVTGRYTETNLTSHHEVLPEITMGFDRDVAALAKGIKTRIYNDVLAMTKRAESIKETRRVNEMKREHATMILEEAGAERAIHSHARSNGGMNVSLPNTNAYVHDMRVSNDGSSVQMELRALNIGTAKAIVELLKKGNN